MVGLIVLAGTTRLAIRRTSWKEMSYCTAEKVGSKVLVGKFFPYIRLMFLPYILTGKF